jgi:hypothetical protein
MKRKREGERGEEKGEGEEGEGGRKGRGRREEKETYKHGRAAVFFFSHEWTGEAPGVSCTVIKR